MRARSVSNYRARILKDLEQREALKLDVFVPVQAQRTGKTKFAILLRFVVIT